MKVLVLAASMSGNKTVNATKQFYSILTKQYGEEYDIKYINLQEKKMAFSDGRNYLDYEGDTLEVLKEIMAHDVLIFSTPIYQASIPAALKNIFDLLPIRAFERKIVGLIITAGSPRHYLVGETEIKPILNYMYASIVPKYVFIIEDDFRTDGTVNDEIEFRFQDLIEDTIITAETYQAVWKKQDDRFGF